MCKENNAEMKEPYRYSPKMNRKEMLRVGICRGCGETHNLLRWGCNDMWDLCLECSCKARGHTNFYKQMLNGAPDLDVEFESSEYFIFTDSSSGMEVSVLTLGMSEKGATVRDDVPATYRIGIADAYSFMSMPAHSDDYTVEVIY